MFRAVFSLILATLASAKYYYPQFNKDGMTHDEIYEHDRLIAINKFVEEFRGWDDDAP